MNSEDVKDLILDLDEILGVGDDGFGAEIGYYKFKDTARTEEEEFYKERVDNNFYPEVLVNGYFVIYVTTESIGYTGAESLDKSALIVSKNIKESKMPDVSIKDIIRYDTDNYRLLRSPFPLKIGNDTVAYILNLEKYEETINAD